MSLQMPITYFSLRDDEPIGFFVDEVGEVRISLALLDRIMELAAFARDEGQD